MLLFSPVSSLQHPGVWKERTQLQVTASILNSELVKQCCHHNSKRIILVIHNLDLFFFLKKDFWSLLVSFTVCYTVLTEVNQKDGQNL